MPRSHRNRLTMTTALAALLLPAVAGGALAQDAGFAIEVGPSADGYTPVQVGARVFGPTVEPASAYVRGCAGSVMAESAGAQFEVTGSMPILSFTGAGDGVRSLVLGTPDGLYRCALADDRGYVSTTLAEAATGRYRVWLGGDAGATLDARLIAADRAISAIELFGLDLSRLGEPRAGRHVYAASAESGRQDLVLGGPLYAETELRALSAENCWGYARLDAADVVLTLDQATDRFSLFATSDRDLVLAVVDPAGGVHCNDDSYQLNPAVTFDGAMAGDYQVFVGGYGPGGGSFYDLYASAGGPAFGGADVNLDTPPRQGYALFDMNAAGQGQVLASGIVNGYDPMEMLPTGFYCAGFTDISAPDLVMTLDAAQPMISVYAMSESDLTLAMLAPDGSWHCNDDAFNLNPGLSVSNAPAGDYRIWVGAFNPGESSGYNLYASMGSPNWQGAAPGTGGSTGQTSAVSLNAGAEPAIGRIGYGPASTVDPRIIMDIAASSTEAFGLGDGCAGFITPERPDLVLDVEAGLPQLMVYMVSEADGTLVIQGPDGALHCNDDFEMLNPGVLLQNPMPGAYAIFAGSYAGTGGLATLGVTIAAPVWTMDREH